MPTDRRRRLCRWLGALVLASAAALVPASPAAADPAAPGDVESEVTGIEPPAPVRARVRGGDSFLELRVERGHEAVVLDYEGFDYLRFAADGTVEVNRSSAAHYLNEQRYVDADAPAGLDPSRPDWHRVAGDGTYAWHDHRMHWMSPTVAPEQAWRVDLRVDGVPVAVLGRYGPVAPPPAWPWWLVAAGALAATVVAGRRRALPLAAMAGLGAAVAAPVVVALAGLPAATWAETALVAAAALAAGAGAALGRRRGPVGAAVLVGAGVALGLWAIRRTDVFGHAVLVTELPAWLDRLAVALALGGGVGVVVAAARLVLVVPPPAPAAAVVAPTAGPEGA